MECAFSGKTPGQSKSFRRLHLRFIVVGGRLVDESGAMIVVRADSEAELAEELRDDLWTEHGVLRRESTKRWEVSIDELHR